MNLYRYRLTIAGGILLCTLVGNYWGRHTEAATNTASQDFFRLASFPLQGWTFTTLKLTEHERDLLKPDAVILRNYKSPNGEMVQLAVIAGHRKQTVHTPAFCMTGGGWTTISTSDWTTQVGNVPVHATQALMVQAGQQMVATYFFTDGLYCTQSLPRFQTEQFMQRLRGRAPLGALIRITVPIQQDQAIAEQVSGDFAHAVLPEILSQIRRARAY